MIEKVECGTCRFSARVVTGLMECSINGPTPSKQERMMVEAVGQVDRDAARSLDIKAIMEGVERGA